MRYMIISNVDRVQRSEELSVEGYRRVKESKRYLSIVVSIEEKLDLILENYADYERALLELTLHRMLFRNLDGPLFREDVQTITRILTNLLSAARLYVDQVIHDLSSIYGSDSAQVTTIRDRFSEEYDAVFGYRVMDAVRNHMQHRSLPIKRMTYQMQADEPGVSGTRVRYSIRPSLDVAVLREDKKFKKPVAKELASRGRYVQLTPLVREYVEAIGRVHELLREIIGSDVAGWETTLGEIEARIKKSYPGEILELSLACENEEGMYEEEYIAIDLVGYRESLANKNRLLSKLSSRYVSGANYE